MRSNCTTCFEARDMAQRKTKAEKEIICRRYEATVRTRLCHRPCTLKIRKGDGKAEERSKHAP